MVFIWRRRGLGAERDSNAELTPLEPKIPTFFSQKLPLFTQTALLMPIHSTAPPREDVCLSQGQSFRLLRWRGGPETIELLHSGARAEPWQGFGNRWHYHPEYELAAVWGARARYGAAAVPLPPARAPPLGHPRWPAPRLPLPLQPLLLPRGGGGGALAAPLWAAAPTVPRPPSRAARLLPPLRAAPGGAALLRAAGGAALSPPPSFAPGGQPAAPRPPRGGPWPRPR